MDIDAIERMVRETERAKSDAAIIQGMRAVHDKTLEAIAAVPAASRGRPQGIAADLCFYSALMADAMLDRAKASADGATVERATHGDEHTKAARSALFALLKAAEMAGAAGAYALMSSERKKGASTRKPSPMDKIIRELADTEHSAPKAAELLRTHHKVPLGQVHLERKIRSLRRALKG